MEIVSSLSDDSNEFIFTNSAAIIPSFVFRAPVRLALNRSKSAGYLVAFCAPRGHGDPDDKSAPWFPVATFFYLFLSSSYLLDCALLTSSSRLAASFRSRSSSSSSRCRLASSFRRFSASFLSSSCRLRCSSVRRRYSSSFRFASTRGSRLSSGRYRLSSSGLRRRLRSSSSRLLISSSCLRAISRAASSLCRSSICRRCASSSSSARGVEVRYILLRYSSYCFLRISSLLFSSSFSSHLLGALRLACCTRCERSSSALRLCSSSRSYSRPTSVFDSRCWSHPSVIASMPVRRSSPEWTYPDPLAPVISPVA
ncbi:hypothetical protein PUN28_008606 [Cardiocondyla obscurior]|uniref:Uncharacterized protein n=1 Tax=Cardiocondyla obscurior TaxID=286306 RepID=A0AAW2G1R1_9HYME